MSHLIEEYAKCLGVKITKPIISSHFFPIQCDKYITIQSTNKFPSRDYSHWSQVVYLLKKYIKDISIVQVGEKSNPTVRGVDIDLRSKTTLKQLSYVIENSILHLGIDSLCIHLASAHDIPCVGLYSNMWSSNSGPVWHENSEFICIDSDKGDLRACYSTEENPKTIDNIQPEEVASSVLKLLHINNHLDLYETLNIGPHYHTKIIEVIPDFLPKEDLFPDRLVNLRCDYLLEEDSLKYWLHRKVNLMINKKIDLNLLNYFKKNIAGSTIFLEGDNIDAEYLESLNSIGIKYNLICKDKDQLNNYRFKFFDFVINEYRVNLKKDLDFSSKLCHNTYYHSNKIIISKNKYYSSKAAWKANIPKSSNPERIIDNADFWEEVDYINIYNNYDKK